jgi:hypothetical protein
MGEDNMTTGLIINISTSHQMNGYQLIAAGNWHGFISQYGLNIVIWFSVAYLMIYTYQKLLELYFREKRQRERMKLLPGIYK